MRILTNWWFSWRRFPEKSAHFKTISRISCDFAGFRGRVRRIWVRSGHSRKTRNRETASSNTLFAILGTPSKTILRQIAFLHLPLAFHFICASLLLRKRKRRWTKLPPFSRRGGTFLYLPPPPGFERGRPFRKRQNGRQTEGEEIEVGAAKHNFEVQAYWMRTSLRKKSNYKRRALKKPKDGFITGKTKQRFGFFLVTNCVPG